MFGVKKEKVHNLTMWQLNKWHRAAIREDETMLAKPAASCEAKKDQ